MQLLKGSFVRLEDYKLETAARTLLGEGKVLGPAHTAEDIERCWREDLPRFLHYNFTDARLVSDILGRTRLLPLAVRRSLLTGMPLERVGASIAAFDFLYLGELRRRGFVAPTAAVANASTSCGQAILFWTRERVEGLGYEVLYGDTDSIFVRSGVADPMEARQMGERLAARLNGELASEILNRHRVESRLSLEFQTLFRKLFLPTSRGETAGSKKRYAGLTLREPGQGGEKREEIVFVGLESVRRDWTRLARNFQQELIRRVFAGEPLEPYIRGLVREVREGRHDALLVYRKALRKRMEEYTETTPPHVKAARKLSGKPGRSIEYIVTLAGPEPVGQLTARPDYEHYIDRPLAPIANAVLVNFNTSFQEVLGE